MLQKLYSSAQSPLHNSCNHGLLGNGQHSKPSSLHLCMYLSRLMMQTVINKHGICYRNRVANAFQEILRFSLALMCTFSAFNLERDIDCLETKIKGRWKEYNRIYSHHDKSHPESRKISWVFYLNCFLAKRSYRIIHLY